MRHIDTLTNSCVALESISYIDGQKGNHIFTLRISRAVTITDLKVGEESRSTRRETPDGQPDYVSGHIRRENPTPQRGIELAPLRGDSAGC